MAKNKAQRVGVFVDIQNMYYSARQLHGRRVNFAAILKDAIADRELVRAIAYVIKADVGEEQSFFEALVKIGYEVRSKDLQVFFGGAKKGDWDVGIAMDIMRMASKLDTVVLVSGDGDFKDLLEHVKSLGCRAEVIAFGKTTSGMLKAQADHFIDMDQNRSKYLFPARSAQKLSAGSHGSMAQIASGTVSSGENALGPSKESVSANSVSAHAQHAPHHTPYHAQESQGQGVVASATASASAAAGSVRRVVAPFQRPSSGSQSVPPASAAVSRQPQPSRQSPPARQSQPVRQSSPSRIPTPQDVKPLRRKPQAQRRKGGAGA